MSTPIIARDWIRDRMHLPDGSEDIGIHPQPDCGPPIELLWEELRNGTTYE